MDDEVAPSCPISYSQEPSNPRGTAAVRLPSIPIATDLPSLIRAVNIIRDILRSLTTSLTVNNTYYGKSTPSKQYAKKDYLMSDYDSDWYQVGIDNKEGTIYNKTKTKTDTKQKVYVERMDAVEFRNNARDNDQSFFWRYPKAPDAEGGGDPVYQEDFFERIVNVKWKKETPPQWTVDWFWQVEAHDINSIDGEPFCQPWTRAPDTTRALFITCTAYWANPVFRRGFFSRDIVVSGEPTSSGAGSVTPYFLCHMAGGNHTIEGESASFPINAWKLRDFDCWGSHDYPPPSFAAYWSVRGYIGCVGEGNFGLFGTPGDVFVNVGTISIEAGGITAATKEGKPLQKKKTTIQISNNAYAGYVHVIFIDPDNPPDS